MKHSTKRVLGILICLAMVLAMLPLAAFAATPTTIYFDNSVKGWETVNAYFWDATGSQNNGWPGTAMTNVGGDIWSVEVPDYAVNVIFNNGNGTQTGDLVIPTDGKNQHNGTSWGTKGSDDYEEVVTEYFLVGSFNGWATGDANYKLTDNGDGTYSITATMPAGNVEYKVVDNSNNWFPSTPDNLKLTVEADGDFEFVFTAESGETVATAVTGEPDPSVPESSETTPSVPESSETTPSVPESSETTPSVPESSETEPSTPVVLSDYIVAGQAALCGSEWDPADANNKMAVVSEGVFAITYKNVAAGTYEFKVTKGSWAENWGVGGPDGANVVAEVAEVSDVTITFVAATGEITVTVGEAGEQGPTQAPTQPSVDTESVGKSDYFVAGQPGLCGAEWDPAAEANRMDLNAEGICFITYKNVAAGEYQFKVTKGSWEANWGGNGPDGNYVINVTGGDVTISFNPATGAIVVVGAVETNPNTGDMSMASVAIALLAATAGVVAIVGKKKEF